MSNWDDEEEETVVAAPAPKITASKKGKYADEDASDDDLKDDWDASDDEETLAKKAAAAKPTGPAPPVRAKGITKQKIAEKEAAAQAREEELAQRREDEADPQARKEREKAAMLKSDMDNAAALFGTAETVDPFTLNKFKTDTEVTAAAIALAELVIKKFAKNPLYSNFTVEFSRAIAAPLKDAEVRKVVTALTVLSNEKKQEAKDLIGGKKKTTKRPALGASKTVGAGRADTGTYEEALDDSGDYDDFM